jgi:hypothetical protein
VEQRPGEQIGGDNADQQADAKGNRKSDPDTDQDGAARGDALLHTL